MKTSVVLLAVLVAVASAACPSYEGAVDLCHNITNVNGPSGLCRFWDCIASYCDESFVVATRNKKCNPKLALIRKELPVEFIKHTPGVKTGTPNVASPCGGGDGPKSVTEIRHWLLDVAMDGYHDRAHEHYTEGSQRWSGIDGKVCPTKAPVYSDCSSFVTWIYWTLFGKGGDFLNGESWSAGYTGTLIEHGTMVGAHEKDFAIGDLLFYYEPVGHTDIYVGGGKVVSHGADPVGYFAYNAITPFDYARRYV